MKAAIFDLDGTLLDSMGFWRKVIDIYLEQRGKIATQEIKDTIDNLTITKSGQYLKDVFGFLEEPKEIEQQILGIIEGCYKFNIPLKPYVHLFLNKLKKKGVKLCVASATPSYLIEYALERHNILDMFEFIITCEDVGEGKKDSAKIYEEALLKLDVKKDEAVIFEDALYAIKTAKAAGFYVVGVKEAVYKNETEEIKSLCDKYIKNFNEFKEI